jgi:gliding motility-associated-like protein
MRISLLILFILPLTVFCQPTVQGSTTGTCDCFQLTGAINESGSVWSEFSFDLNNPFDFNFEVNLGCNDVWGADGIVFVLQSNPSGTGAIGNGIGYSSYVGNPTPISPFSIGVEIDTWDSNPAVITDIPSDHVGMNSGGSNSHDVVGPIAIPNIEDCLSHTVQITWDPIGQNFEFFIDGTSIFIYNGDMVTNFFGGNPNVYFGWTGGTGGVMNVQSVCFYRNAAYTANQTTVCENQVITFTDNSTSDLNMIVGWDWDFGDGSTSTQQNPTYAYPTAGNYIAQLTITDISGCTDVITQNITVTPGLNLNMTATNMSCFGVNDGTTTATPTNGTGPYNYIWDDPGTQATQTATGLGVNTYNVNVSDANGCVGTASIAVTEPTQLLLDSAVAVDASCGINNGTITFYANGGTPAYQYSIDGGVTFQAASSFLGLGANVYNLELQDANGCSVVSTATVNSNSAMVLDSLVAVDETCGAADGSVTAYVNLGLAPYQYSIDGGATYQAANLFSNLTANTYTVQILDANNCVVTGNVTVNSPTTLQIDLITPTNPSCNGFADGQIDLTASGGTGPYTYSVDNGLTFQVGTNFSGLTSGIYNVVVQDVNSCQITGNTTLVDPIAVIINSAIATAVSCAGDTDGQINIVASGGLPGYTYSVDGGLTFQAGTSFTNLAPNTYNIQVNDANNCFATTTATVNEPLPLVIDSIVVLDVTCNGLMDGGVTVYANQGTPAYTFSIDGGVTFQGGQVFTALGAGLVNVDVLDLNGCTTSGNATITESQPLLATIDVDTTICIGGTATLCPTVIGGIAPFSYNWNGTVGPACLAVTAAGTFNVIVTDANNCTSALVSEDVFQFPPISVLTSLDVTICAGDSTVITAEATGGDGGPYTYTWLNQTNLTALTGQIQTVVVNQNTTFSIAVTDGCETPPGTGSVTISTFQVPTIQISADTTSGCEPVDVQFTNNTDPLLLASSSWILGNGEVFSGTGTFVSTTYDTPGCYDVFVQIVTVDGCIADTNLASFICVYEVPVADFDFNPLDPDILESTVQFDNNSNGAINYDWTFGDGNSSTDINPSNTYPEIGAATYTVQLIASTPFGCADTTSQLITINEVILFYAQNAMTLNGDGMNDDFRPIFIPGFNPLGYFLRIFDRWGTLVFETQDLNAAWDGTYEGKNVIEDTYVWQVTFRENQTDITHRNFGHVTVLK